MFLRNRFIFLATNVTRSTINYLYCLQKCTGGFFLLLICFSLPKRIVYKSKRTYKWMIYQSAVDLLTFCYVASVEEKQLNLKLRIFKIMALHRHRHRHILNVNMPTCQLSIERRRTSKSFRGYLSKSNLRRVKSIHL